MALITCSECNKEISDKSTACVHCGSPVAVKETSNVTQARPAPGANVAGGVAVGCLSGSMTAFMVGGIGFLLCLTGIGAIVGVPMIIIAFFVPFIAPLITGGVAGATILGPCPYCGINISCSKLSKSVECPECKKKIVIDKMKFYTVS